MIGVLVTKIVVLLALLVATLLFSLLPLKLKRLVDRQVASARRRRFKAAMSLMSCFAAGVFLATCLLDLFPEVRKNIFQALKAVNVETKFPLPEFILVLGLFFILLVEQMALMFHTPHKNNSAVSPKSPLLGSSGPSGAPENSQRHDYRSIQDAATGRGLDSSIYSESGEFFGASEDEVHENPPEGDEGETADKELYQDPNSHSPIRSLILLCALSLHSVFEGLALGLQPKTANVLQLFTAVVIHKSVLAFSLGLNLVQSTLSLKALLRSVVVFAITAPIGIAIGIIITDLAQDNTAANLTNGVLQGVACGTFLYVVFFEILPHEFMSKRQHPNRMLKMLLLLLGYSTTVTLLFLHPE